LPSSKDVILVWSICPYLDPFILGRIQSESTPRSLLICGCNCKTPFCQLVTSRAKKTPDTSGGAAGPHPTRNSLVSLSGTNEYLPRTSSWKPQMQENQPEIGVFFGPSNPSDVNALRPKPHYQAPSFGCKLSSSRSIDHLFREGWPRLGQKRYTAPV
jgi:hypothetical protein